MFLTYDLRGAQRFIFRVPVLQAIIGGSGLITRFDEFARAEAESAGAEVIFVGAGHGLFSLPPGLAARLRDKFLAKAAYFAMDLRIGVGDTPPEALGNQRDHPFLPPPEEMEGDPCYISGLYPYDPNNAGRVRDHEAVNLRVYRRFRINGSAGMEKAADRIDQRVLHELGCDTIPPSGKYPLPEPLTVRELEFFRAVTASRSDDADTRADADRGRAALGGRNRWAVICMDGNNIGAHFGHLASGTGQAARNAYPAELHRRLSEALNRSTWHALSSAIAAGLAQWCSEFPEQVEAASYESPGATKRCQVLPLRPLICGGDDLVILCHPSLAFTFVRTACRAFADASRSEDTAYRNATAGEMLWKPTGGALSISAGILFCSVTFPLHLAIPYAEELLSNAKNRGNDAMVEGQPPPACVDWESITEGLVESLALRRKRDYEIVDPEALEARGKPAGSGVPTTQLTDRPYTMEDFDHEVEARCARLRHVPHSVLVEARTRFRCPYYDRAAYRLSLAKHQPELAAELDEESRVPDPARDWRRTLDAIDVLTEERRMKRRPADG